MPKRRVRATHSIFRQAYGSGECGLCAVVAAVDTVCHNVDEDAAGHLLSVLARVLPTDPQATPADLARILYEDGTERPEMERMLPAAQGWTQRKGWPAWHWQPAHPRPGEETAEQFWERLSAVPQQPHTAVIIGLGEDATPDTRYGGHWTCVQRIRKRRVFLHDSDIYRRILRAETGIDPEPGWRLEDCFILRRS
jgi:hypothetical protein